MIDVHILTLPGREPWLAECVDSLQQEPIIPRILEGVSGDFAESRKKGYLSGHSPWVTYIDDDDRIIPGAFHLLLQAVQNNPLAPYFYMYEETINVEGISQKRCCKTPHHLILYRRAFIMDNQDVFCYTNPDSELLRRAFSKSKGHCLDRIGYQWRHHDRMHSRGFYNE